MVSFEKLLLVLGLAVSIVWILRKVHMPPILGYLLTGILVGPYSFGLMENKDSLNFVAEFGVVFLLFTIGLELSFPKLFAMRRALLGLGGLQVVISTAVVLAVGHWAGLDLPASIAVAGALALSSTAVATKILIEEDELHQDHGRLSLSILLFQDLAAVPFLIIVPALSSAADGPSMQETFLNAAIMGGVVFIGMLAAGRWLLRPLFHNIAQARSTELFMLGGLLLVLVSAFITEHVGLSLALGAFLAGVMLAETEYAHQIESDILPFRDILLGLFFITVGMKLDPLILIYDWYWLILMVLSIVLIKTLIVALLGIVSKNSPASSIRAGLTLAQGGEFGFALLALAATGNIIDPHANQLTIAAIILSIGIAPILIRNSLKIATVLLPKSSINKSDLERSPLEETDKLQNHVIICGYGRVGQTLARFLEFEGIPFVGLDMDPVRLKEARAALEPVYYGDSSDKTILKAAGIEKAQLLIIAYDDDSRSLKSLSVVRELNQTIPILVRTQDDRHLDQLNNAGATEVISDRLESSLMLASHMLMLLGTPPDNARRQVWEVKMNRYKLLSCYFSGQEDNVHLEGGVDEQVSLHAVTLTEGAFAIGKTLATLSTEQNPIHVASFTRGGFKSEAPAAETVFKVGDILVLMGTQDALFSAEERLLQG